MCPAGLASAVVLLSGGAFRAAGIAAPHREIDSDPEPS